MIFADSFLGMRVDIVNYSLIGLIGHKISYSISPVIHNYWLGDLSILGDYVLIDLTMNNLRDFIEIAPKIGFIGCNVTTPYKHTIRSYCSNLSDRAKLTGAINTITFRKEGCIYGDNTDVMGIKHEITTHYSLSNKHNPKVVIIGAGGAASAALYALIEMGISNIVIVNRTDSKSEELLDFYNKSNATDSFYLWQDRWLAINSADIIINSTRAKVSSCLFDGELKNLHNQLIFDMNYFYPPEEVRVQLTSNTVKYVNGIGMLISQARESFYLWFEKYPDKDDFDHLLK